MNFFFFFVQHLFNLICELKLKSVLVTAKASIPKKLYSSIKIEAL